MELSKLIKKYSKVTFKPDGKDANGVFMIVENYRMHLRKDDYKLVQGMLLEDVWPLIDEVKPL